jgi:hypothetical protein
MRIKAISAGYSDATTIALVTEPPLTPEIFAEVARMAVAPELAALSLRMVSGCLVINSPVFSRELRNSLDDLLTEAESVISPPETSASLERSEKEMTLEAAAAGFELPIE